jgi:branched-chain amino acid transport system permease protein
MEIVGYIVWAVLILLPLLAAWLALEPALGGARRTLMWSLLGLASLAALVIAPHLVSFSHQELLVFLVINTLLVVSYRLLALTGEFSLAHVVLMGVGAYASAIFTKDLGVPVFLSMLLSAGVAALIAFILAFPLFRMKGFYFLIGSFAAGEAIRLTWKRFQDPFGGPKGITRIPGVPDIESLGLYFWEPITFYYFALIIVIVAIWVLWRIERSHIGLTFHAVHWQDQLAGAVGVDTWRARTMAMVIASFFAGLAGTLLAHYLTTVNPNRFSVDEMVFVLIWVIVGGTTTIWGPIVGLIALTVINEVVLRDAGVDELRPLFYGLILICAMLFLPGGVETLPKRIADRLRRDKPEAIQPAE